MVTLLFSLSPWSQRKVRRATAERPVTGPWGWQLDQVVGFLQRVVLVYSTSIVKRKSTCLPPRTSQKKKKKKEKNVLKRKEQLKDRLYMSTRFDLIWFHQRDDGSSSTPEGDIWKSQVNNTRTHSSGKRQRSALPFDTRVGRRLISWPTELALLFFTVHLSPIGALVAQTHERKNKKTKQ